MIKLQGFKSSFKFNKSYIINSLWAIGGAFITRGTSFIAIAIIAKLIGPKLFGEYNVIQSTIGLFGTVSGLGLGLAATKLIAEWRSKDLDRVGELLGSLYTLSILIGFLVAVTFFLTANVVAKDLLHNSSLATLLQITAIIVIFDAVNGVQNGVLSGFEEFKSVAYINLITGLSSAPLLIVGALYNGLLGLTLMLLFTRFLAVLVTRIYIKNILLRKSVVIKPVISYNKLKPIFKISLPAFFSNMATSPINWISTTIFVNQSFGYSSLGTFNAANQLRQLVLFLPDSAGKVSIPKMANAYGNNDMKEFKKVVMITFFWNLLLSTIPAVFVYFFSFLFRDFIGNKFTIESSLILSILVTGILVALSNAVGYIFICSNLMWYDFALRIFWGISLIAILWFYGKDHGALGFSLSTLGAYILYLFSQGVFLFFRFFLLKNKF